MLISVIVPVYNGEKTIERCIKSILNQTYKEIEIIIINDGSSDKTSNICDALKKLDDRIKIFNIKNQGVSFARNCGVKNAKGEFIQFVDADDYIEKEMIKAMVEEIKKDVELVISGYEAVYERERKSYKLKKTIKTKAEFFRNIGEIIENGVNLSVVWNKLYKKKIIEKEKLSFKEDLTISEDLYFNLEYLNKVEKISQIDGIYYKYFSSGYFNKYRKNQIDMHKKVNFFLKECIINNKADTIENIQIVEKMYCTEIIVDCISIIKDESISLKEKRKIIKRAINEEYFIEMMKNTKLSTKKNIIYFLFKINITFTIILLKFIINLRS